MKKGRQQSKRKQRAGGRKVIYGGTVGPETVKKEAGQIGQDLKTDSYKKEANEWKRRSGQTH